MASAGRLDTPKDLQDVFGWRLVSGLLADVGVANFTIASDHEQATELIGIALNRSAAEACTQGSC